MTTTITIYLSSYNLGNDATDADFDAWAAFVARELPKRIEGVDVEVTQARFGEAGEDRIGGDATDEQTETIRDLLAHDLWDDWCSEPTKYRIVTISGRGLRAGIDADGYDTRAAAEAMCEDGRHDGEYRIEAYVSEAWDDEGI